MIPHIILAASLVAAPSSSLPVAHNPADGLSELRSILCNDSLMNLRAGAPALVRPIDDQERADLQAAASSAQDLSGLRAGAMTDREWIIVGVVLLAVLVIVILA